MQPARAMPVLLLTFLLATAAPADTRPPADDDLVDVTTIVPGLRVDMRYATPNNFTKRAVYTDTRCRLRRDVARRLGRVQAALGARGFGLKVFDCFRSLAVQRIFWNLHPDPRYVADPRRGSRHNRGAAVDLTLVTAAGVELPMPTAWDEANEKAHRDYQRLPPALLRNRAILEDAMVHEGFLPLPTEWWHFDAPDWRRYRLEM
jgi:D-alanyl-D-alanine dipeptidase